MSVSSPYTQRPSPGVDRCRVVPNKGDKNEDCRDYLRTGRCKYGASCKYNHPLNVQSGGGMKAPIDPSEPLFPIRYNEPLCQYYMKHGTCKFGQACKFHHPPQIAGTSCVMNGNNSVLVNTTSGGRKEDGGPHLGAIWKARNDSGVQMLPQRPDEPNCIYFLKNGRCKYGSACRYHHPLKYHHDNTRCRNVFEDVRSNSNNSSRLSQDHRSAAKVHYVTTLPSGSTQQGHFVVADGTVTFLSLDGNNPAHVVSISHPAGAGAKELTTAGTVASSTSSTSIASSFETSVTNVDTANEASTGSLWNNRKVSGNVSGVYGLPRVVSTGNNQSDSSSSLFYDSNSGPSSWRTPRSSSFDHTRTCSASNSKQEKMIRSSSAHSVFNERTGEHPLSSSTASTTIRGGIHNHRDSTNTSTTITRHLPGEVDDGLSMMTSALLTMLDTPAKNVSVFQQNEKCDVEEGHFATSSSLDNLFFTRPTLFNRATATASDDSLREYQNDHLTCYGQTHVYGRRNVSTDHQETDLQTRSTINVLDGQPEGQSILNQISRIQSWQGSAAAGVIHENVQLLSINPTQQLPSSASNTPTNIGLYY